MRLALILLTLCSMLAGCDGPTADSEAAPAQAGGGAKPGPPPRKGPALKPLRVLFVGNSYTSFNRLSSLIAELARAAGKRPLDHVNITPGGRTLAQHATAGRVASRLASGRWDAVVLQDQSQVPSFHPKQVEREVLPGVKTLCDMARKAKARPVMFMTWGYRNGDRRNFKTDTYLAMQQRLERGYRAMARHGKASVAPVGLAWRRALAAQPGLDLWVGDDSHPRPAGSYLAACVLFGTLYDAPVRGNTFRAQLTADQAAKLQAAADAACAAEKKKKKAPEPATSGGKKPKPVK